MPIAWTPFTSTKLYNSRTLKKMQKWKIGKVVERRERERERERGCLIGCSNYSVYTVVTIVTTL